MNFLKCMGSAIWRVLNGLKTIITGGGLLAVALADELQGIDIKGFAAKVFGEDERVGKYIAIVTALFLVLRFMSTSSVFAGLKNQAPASQVTGDDEGETE